MTMVLTSQLIITLTSYSHLGKSAGTVSIYVFWPLGHLINAFLFSPSGLL